MQKKVTIIGAGAVGSTTAFALLTRGAASEVVLIDVNTSKALGEALDIKQATPFIDNCDIYAGSYQDAAGSDVVIITSGIGRKPGQSRLELVQTNVEIIRQISTEIVKVAPNAIYIIVANPVDILTYAFLKYTGLPKSQVIGTGTALDTIRLRTRLAEIYNVNKQQVHANVLGEHGDTSFVAWSTATIAGIPLDEYNAAIASAYAFIRTLNGAKFKISSHFFLCGIVYILIDTLAIAHFFSCLATNAADLDAIFVECAHAIQLWTGACVKGILNFFATLCNVIFRAINVICFDVLPSTASISILVYIIHVASVD